MLEKCYANVDTSPQLVSCSDQAEKCCVGHANERDEVKL